MDGFKDGFLHQLSEAWVVAEEKDPNLVVVAENLSHIELDGDGELPHRAVKIRRNLIEDTGNLLCSDVGLDFPLKQHLIIIINLD